MYPKYLSIIVSKKGKPFSFFKNFQEDSNKLNVVAEYTPRNCEDAIYINCAYTFYIV